MTYRTSLRAAGLNVRHQITSVLGEVWEDATPEITEQIGIDPVTGDSNMRVKFAIGAGNPQKFLRLRFSR